MAWKLNDWVCTSGHRFEYLSASDDDVPACACGATAERALGAAPPIVIWKGNSDFSQREAERLDKRSQEHWERKGKHEGRDRALEQMRRFLGG